MKLLFVLVALTCLYGAAQSKIINCYYGTWANYRPGNGRFTPSDIDPSLCTHITYTFFGMSEDGQLRILDSWLDNDDGLGYISKTVALKQRNPNLKVIAAVGGWNEGSQKYSVMAGDPGRRSTFVNSVVNFLNQHNFDGFDLDWEYPAQRGGGPQDVNNYVTLLTELKNALKAQNKLLGIAVGATAASAGISYDIPRVAEQVDYINVMTYDLGGAFDGKVGFNSPLRGQEPNNMETSINYWLNSGAPAHKIIAGCAFYGRTFTLSNPNENWVGAGITGGGTAGPYTRESGYLGYNEVCEDGQWNIQWSDEHQVPFAQKGNQWIGFDNVRSIGIKMDFVKSKGLGGAFMWSIETDDFRGVCGESYPLLKTMNRALN